MSPSFITAQLHGTPMPIFYGPAKPVALGGRVWRQRPVEQLVSGATGTGVSTTDNSTRVSEVEHRRT